METENAGMLLSIIGAIFTIIGAFNGILLLFLRAELKNIREWVDYNKQKVDDVERRFQNCQLRCRQDQKELYTNIIKIEK